MAAGPVKVCGSKPLSAQAKPGRPSGVDKKEGLERAGRRRRRVFTRGFQQGHLVGDKGHVRLSVQAANLIATFITDLGPTTQAGLRPRHDRA